MDLTPVTLRGRHVVLEPLARAHARELERAASERDIWRYMTADASTPAGIAAWVSERVAARETSSALPFLQRDAATHEAIGATSLFDLDARHKRGEIGHTWLAASHRRTPANTEAKLLLFTHAFAALGLHRVQLKTDGRNVRSQRAIERLGATREGVLRRHMVVQDGFVRDSVVYSVTDVEWPGVKAHLEALLPPR
ncbi:MAG: GNAT family N-acetyltransferase [Thermoplasmatota archaeon]